MTDLEQELNNTETVQDENQTEDNNDNLNQVQDNDKPQTLEEVLNSQQKEEVQELWKESNNYKQGLWKTPDDIMKSVQYYEKKFQPLEMTMKNLGFKEPSELEQAFKDFQQKMPVYQENENTINLLNALLQNQTYGSKLRNVFDEIRKAQEMERYGISFDQLPPVIQEKVAKGEQAFQQLEEMRQEQAYNNALSTIQDQMAQIEQIVQETGLEFDQQGFLQYCKENNIPPSAMKGEFLNANYSQMLERAKQNASLATSAQNKQNKIKALNSSTKQQTAQTQIPTMNNISDLENALNQIQ